MSTEHLLVVGALRVLIVSPIGGGMSGGYRKYLRDIVPALKNQLAVGSVSLAVRRGATSLPVDSHSYGGFAELRRLTGELRPDVVLLPTARPLQGLNVPVVCMVRNMEPFDHPTSPHQPLLAAKSLLRRRQALAACASASRVIAVSDHVRHVLQVRGVPRSKLRVVPHGVETPTIACQSRPAALSDGSEFIFTAGSLRPARGLEDLLEALEDLPRELRLVVAGAATSDMRRYEHSLRSRTNRSSIAERVVWAGHLTPAEMTWCFAQAQMFVSTTRAEACPNTLLEAMAHGQACIATDGPPMPEFLGDAGLYYRAGDTYSLSTAVRSLLSDTTLHSELQRRASAAVAEMTWERCARRTADVLVEAVSEARSAFVPPLQNPPSRGRR